MDTQYQDEKDLLLREKNPPISHPKPKDLFCSAVETFYVSLACLGEAINRRDDPLLSLAVQTLQVLLCSTRPADLAAQ